MLHRMIERIADVPGGVLGFEAVGEVSAEDYRDVVVPAIAALGESGGEARVLLVLGPRFERFSAGAMWQDAKMAFQHVRWARAALVTDVEWVRHLTGAFGWMVPGEFRTFAVAERAAATAWVAGDVDRPASA
jgi:hypothetical protein